MSVSSKIISLVKRPKNRVFRRLYMKRREVGGDYEANWQEIPSRYIKKIGNVSIGIEDVKVNFYKYSGLDLELSNDGGYFNDVTDTYSFFANKLTVYRTLLRLDAGYIDDDDTEYPTTSSIYYGIIGEGIERKDNGVITLESDHITKVIDEVQADDIPGLGSTQTASDIISKIRDYQDSGGTYILQNYIPTWNIETTTTFYNIATSTVLQNKTAWDVMKDLAVAENKVIYVNRMGELQFTSIAIPSTASYHFSGPNDTDKSYGSNIIRNILLDISVKNVYNRVSVQYEPGDTTASYYVRKEIWNWGDGSSSFKYGQRTYSYKNLWLNTTTAQTVGDAIYTKYESLTQRAKLTAKFLPDLDIGDRVTVTHQAGTQIGESFSLYGSAQYGTAVYGRYIPGSINLYKKDYSVIAIKHDIDKFTTIPLMEEI